LYALVGTNKGLDTIHTFVQYSQYRKHETECTGYSEHAN